MKKQYSEIDPWRIVQRGFDAADCEAFESLCSLGNGRMGQRANFEEHYSGNSLQGNYFAGIFYPDKTRVGWWKNGYPRYFGKMINSINWVGIDVTVDGIALDLNACSVIDFTRTLDMRDGSLRRTFTCELTSGRTIQAETHRFISAADNMIAAIHYSITPLEGDAVIALTPYLDGNVQNRDSNYGEQFWDQVLVDRDDNCCLLQMRTKPSTLHEQSGIEIHHVCSGMSVIAEPSGPRVEIVDNHPDNPAYVGRTYRIKVAAGQTVTLTKLIANATTLDGPPDALPGIVKDQLSRAQGLGFEKLFDRHRAIWASRWETSDVVIRGDELAQQGIRFCIFQLNQTYTGEDARLNIGPKGFTGEKYGGGTYWDTEAFCFPFYVATAPPSITRNLLIYRYRQLPKAIANARLLGYDGGAALYPMVTINGEECHNEWEITFEEIHRNGAIAFAIYNYVQHTGDERYLAEFGAESLIALARFWRRRATYSKDKQKFVILGVTGPNEYENNVNNNWYTNYIAAWTLRYAVQCLDKLAQNHPKDLARITSTTGLDTLAEAADWNNIAENLHLPAIEGTNIFLQQDGYLDKEDLTAADIPSGERPINQHWSWDRILRSPFIKQADVVQGLYLFANDFSIDVVRDNFDYYEPKTVHESSLSPAIHAVVAGRLGRSQKAYDLFLRSARLDLDDYNHEVHEGLHITSMAGTWLAIVEGFAGKSIVDGVLSLSPIQHRGWTGYSFKMLYRGHILEIDVSNWVRITNGHTEPITLLIYGEEDVIPGGSTLIRKVPAITPAATV